MSNCQDGCQTNSRRYDDLLSTGIHDVNKIKDFLDNFISVVAGYYVFDRTIVWLVLRLMGQYGRPSLATAGFLVGVSEAKFSEVEIANCITPNPKFAVEFS